MAEYKVEVRTGDMPHAGTRDHISVTLIGTEGQSNKTELDRWGLDFRTGQTRSYTVKTPSSLGKPLLVRLEKEKFLAFGENLWYCCSVRVCPPGGEPLLFPCHRWVSRGERVELRQATAVKVHEEDHELLKEHRQRELREKKELYQWKVLQEGLPYKTHFEQEVEIPLELQRSHALKSQNSRTSFETGIELKLKGLLGSEERWETLEEMRKVFWFKKTELSEYVIEHWREDAFFGSQFLNGANPALIRRCHKLPENFPVTEEMVRPFLDPGQSLKSELKEGNVFLYDQTVLEGIPTRVYEGRPLHVTPGLCLLHLNSQKELKPIAIQLHKNPSEDNPIFLPSDSETDWLLAKMFIKNADMLHHEPVSHLLNTHLFSEVYLLAMLRNLPAVHPIYKLLMPHFRFVLPVNVDGRQALFDRIFTKSSLGADGVVELMRRNLSALSYSDLCLPENVASRGLESVPGFYYRDDGLRLWAVIGSFLRAVVERFYPSDADVKRDSELQDWIGEIFTRAFLEKDGFPRSFGSRQELVKFLTMIVFNVSAQHAAVNNGQYDYLSWLPNSSILLVSAPPRAKGQSSAQSLLDALPNVGESVAFLALGWFLSARPSDAIPLGQYPEERFQDPAVEQMVKEFQAELSYLNEAIEERNSGLTIPYTYLLPSLIENSITT